MSVRQKAVEQVRQEAICNSITVSSRVDKRVQRRLVRSEENHDKARFEAIKRNYLEYTLWVMGGSRYDPSSQETDRVRKITEKVVSTLNIGVAHGAGPGIMLAAVNGFYDAKQHAQENGNVFTGKNIAIGIEVPWEKDRDVSLFDYYRNHPELLHRVQELIDKSHAVYIGPGAIGTAFEAWTVVQMKQTGELGPEFPVIADESWRKPFEELKQQWHDDRVAQGERPTMNEHDLDIVFTNDPDKIADIISRSYKEWHESIGKHVRYRRKPFWEKLKRTN